MFAIVAHLHGFVKVKLNDRGDKEKEVAAFMKNAFPKIPYSLQSVWEENGEFLDLTWVNQSTN